VFFHAKPFQLSLIFVGKAGAYPIEEPFRRSHSRECSWPCPQRI